MKIIILITSLIFSLNSWSTISGTIGATSNYVWRGITQTNANAAIQGSLEYINSNLTLGSWFSNTSNSSEADFYANYNIKLAESFLLNSAITYYHYLPTTDINTIEVLLGIDLGWGAFSTSYTTNYFNSDSSAFYFALSNSLDLSQKDKLSLELSIGYSLFNDEFKVGMKSYLDYKISIVKKINNLVVNFNFSDTNLKSNKNEMFSIAGLLDF